MSSPTPPRAVAALVGALQDEGIAASTESGTSRVTARMHGLKMVVVLVGARWYREERPDPIDDRRDLYPLCPAGSEDQAARIVAERLSREITALTELWKATRPRRPQARRVYPACRLPLPRRTTENRDPE